jgi:hypothetical protein
MKGMKEMREIKENIISNKLEFKKVVNFKEQGNLETIIPKNYYQKNKKKYQE